MMMMMMMIIIIIITQWRTVFIKKGSITPATKKSPAFNKSEGSSPSSHKLVKRSYPSHLHSAAVRQQLYYQHHCYSISPVPPAAVGLAPSRPATVRYVGLNVSLQSPRPYHWLPPKEYIYKNCKLNSFELFCCHLPRRVCRLALPLAATPGHF